MAEKQRVGVLLINLGTPDSPSVPDVRRYLREFLMDPRVVDLSPAARWLLVHAIILPTRPPKSAAQYRSIWLDRGSPLLVYSRELTDRVAEALGDAFVVRLGMRYGSPSIASALDELVRADVSRIVVLPLFPQYASASTGSALEKVLDESGARPTVPELVTIAAFFDDPGFIEAFRQVARPVLDAFKPDFVLLSYHGIPERHVRRGDPTGQHCLVRPHCCDAIGPENRMCYRAQCYATSRALVAQLGLEEGRSSTSFQSRLGRTPWVRPYTDEVLPELAQKGVRRLAVLCPAFVADCLETVEEIGVRANEQWRELGGEALTLVPSLNGHPAWVAAVVKMVQERVSSEARRVDGERSSTG